MKEEKSADVNVGDKFVTEFDFYLGDYPEGLEFSEGEEIEVIEVLSGGVNVNHVLWANVGISMEDLEDNFERV